MPNGPDNWTFSPEDFVASDRMGALVGARFVSVTPEECVYEYEASEDHINPAGTLHGGALFTVMDSSQGMLVYRLLEPPYRRALTGTATVKYLAPVRRGRIVVRTTLAGRERRKLFVHSDAIDGKGTVVATLDEIWIAVAN
ncbi:MAG TPA: PaaI family thioesterase [Tepidisphaeraceae bacterium]|nr:PaaI family thioesterase [Tepidisphaeraceae bacterium]